MSQQTSPLVKPERVRFSKKERARIVEYLDLTYGHECSLCGTRENLEIDHKKGLSSNRLTDLQWLCKSCNLAARRLIDSVVQASVSVNVQPGDPDAIAINRLKEPMWVEYCKDYLASGPQLKEHLKGDSAFACNISPSTVDRYLLKHSGYAGEFKVIQNKRAGRIVVDLRR